MERDVRQGLRFPGVRRRRVPRVGLRDAPYAEALEIAKLSRKNGWKERENAGSSVERTRDQGDLVYASAKVRPSLQDRGKAIEGGDVIEVDRIEKHALSTNTPCSADESTVAEGGEILELVREVTVRRV